MTEAIAQAAPPVAEEDATAAVPAPIALPWDDVHPEHFQMLRLLPLPTDRSTGARPLRFIQHGWAERHNAHYSLLRQDVQLPGHKARKEQNHLDLWANHDTGVIHFAPEGGLQLDPINRGLGRFLISQAIAWAQKRWPQYQLEETPLATKDNLNEEARGRRDHVLGAQGFAIEYDELRVKGKLSPLRVSQLKAGWNSERVQIVEVLEASSMLQLAEQKMAEQDIKRRELEEKISKYRREDTGLRFTIACLIAFAVFQAGLLIWIATHR